MFRSVNKPFQVFAFHFLAILVVCTQQQSLQQNQQYQQQYQPNRYDSSRKIPYWKLLELQQKQFGPYHPDVDEDYLRYQYLKTPPPPPPPPYSAYHQPRFNPYSERPPAPFLVINQASRSNPSYTERQIARPAYSRNNPPPPQPPSLESLRRSSSSRSVDDEIAANESRFSKLFGVLGKVLERINIGILFSGKSTKYSEGTLPTFYQSNSGIQSNLAMKVSPNSTNNKASGKTNKLSWLPGRQTSPECDNIPVPDCNQSYAYRTIDGSCNNLDSGSTWWGRARSPYKRLLLPDYDDTRDSPRVKSAVPGFHLPNSRQIAIDIFETIPGGAGHNAKRDITSLLTPYFAEFVSYDIAATPRSNFKRGRPRLCRCNHFSEDCFNIPTPHKDQINRHNQTCMTYVRSLSSTKEFNCDLGPREQLDLATHWLDLSIIYGNDNTESTKLRTFKKGLLRANQNPRSKQSFLPYLNMGKCKNSKYTSSYENKPLCYASGDRRVEDNALTASLATIWLREHNRVATQLGRINPLWSDERLFQETRRIVIAEYQNIVYAEFLPTLIGLNYAMNYELLTLREGFFQEYTSSVYPQVNNEYATAASRFYQTMLPDKQKFSGDSHDKTLKPLSFFMFNNLLYEHKMPNLIRGVLGDKALNVAPQLDKYLQDMLWNELYYDEETIRWSLSALDIQQGRDHGLPSYNKYRKLCGLCEAKSFAELDHIPANIVAKLAKVYACPDDIDLFVGLVSEIPLEGGVVGPTAACIIAKQFHDLKFGDRFYFETADPTIKFTHEQLKSIRKVRMSDLICRNVDTIDSVQKYAFYHSDLEWNHEKRCHLPQHYHQHNRRHHHHHHNHNHHKSYDDYHENYYNHRFYHHLQNPNLFLWYEETSFNCTQYLQLNNTQASFVYSFFNSVTDNSINFLLTYPTLTASGLTTSNIHAQCFPVNRTVILTIRGQQPSVNLNLNLIDSESYNASVLLYVQSVNSLFLEEIDVDVSQRSKFGFYTSSVGSEVHVNQSATFDASKRSRVHLQFINTPLFKSTGNWTIGINDSSSFDLCAYNMTSFNMSGSESIQVTADMSDQNYTSCHLIHNKAAFDFYSLDSLEINQLTSTFYTGGLALLQVRRVKTFNSTSSIVFQVGNETANSTTNQNTHVKFELSQVEVVVLNELAFRVYDSAYVIAEIEHVNSVNIITLSAQITGTAALALHDSDNTFKLNIAHIDQLEIDNFSLEANETQACTNIHNITSMHVLNEFVYACDSCDLNMHNISSLNVTLFAVESYSFESVRVSMGPQVDVFDADNMTISDNHVNSSIYFDLKTINFVDIATLTFAQIGKSNFTFMNVTNTTIGIVDGVIDDYSGLVGIDLLEADTYQFTIGQLSNASWINETLFVTERESCSCQIVQIGPP